MMHKLRTKNFGYSTIEMIAGLIFLIPILLTIFDLGCLVVANLTNDTVCRDITRAVAAGDPKDATARATKLVALQNKRASNVISKYALVNPPKNSPGIIIPAPTSGGLVRGSVTVRTRVDVSPPFLIGAIYSGKPFKFESEQTFPYTYFIVATGDDPN